jgi:hypothetical protein
MRLPTEKRSERRMRFFTPSLYLRYNSDDDTIADRADARWEKAIRAYKKHLERFSARMNERVKLVAESLCLHDAEILFFQADIPVHPWFQPPYSRGAATISLKSAGTIVNLFYLLWDEVDESGAPRHWPFSNRRVHWLYDEIDCVDAPPWPVTLFWHRILLSDGRVISIPFTDVVVNSFSGESPQPIIVKRRRA